MVVDLYREVIAVPFLSKFVVFAKRHEQMEAQLRVFCMTDDKMEKTLETQEQFTEVATSRDVEVSFSLEKFLSYASVQRKHVVSIGIRFERKSFTAICVYKIMLLIVSK